MAGKVPKRTTPLPNPPPQGGREQTELAARAEHHSPEGGVERAFMYKKGIEGFPYYLGIASLADVATRADCVCVLNILGGSHSCMRILIRSGCWADLLRG
jgi:hypothetical protein